MIKFLSVIFVIVSLLILPATSFADSNILVGGSCTANSDNGNVCANAYDGSDATWWGESGVPGWIDYDLGVGVTSVPSQVSFLPYVDGGGSYVKNWSYWGSTNNSTWDVLVATTTAANSDGYATTSISTTNAYRYFRMNVADSWNGTNINIKEIQTAGHAPGAASTAPTMQIVWWE